jgi:hypothetical protein
MDRGAEAPIARQACTLSDTSQSEAKHEHNYAPLKSRRIVVR